MFAGAVGSIAFVASSTSDIADTLDAVSGDVTRVYGDVGDTLGRGIGDVSRTLDYGHDRNVQALRDIAAFQGYATEDLLRTVIEGTEVS